jgi:hypothetical protein
MSPHLPTKTNPSAFLLGAILIGTVLFWTAVWIAVFYP